MAVPRKKVTRMKRDQRRSHHALAPVNIGECANCGEMKLPHHICGACGHYNGREVIVARAEAGAEAD